MSRDRTSGGGGGGSLGEALYCSKRFGSSMSYGAVQFAHFSILQSADTAALKKLTLVGVCIKRGKVLTFEKG